MTIPKPPSSKKSKKKISFPDPDKHKEKTNLHQEIRQTLLQLREIMPNPRDRDTILKFVDCISLTSKDVSRLPCGSKATRRNKSACLLALVSWVVQRYWDYCAGDAGIRSIIKANLLGLQEVAEKGLGAFTITGNLATGYKLGW